MEQEMNESNRYNQGKIYTIRSHQTDQFYIGSTCMSLYKRLYKHRNGKKSYEKEKYHYLTSFEILKYDDHYIELLENYPCNSKEELHQREGQLIREHIHKLVNKQIPLRPQAEGQHEYHIKNKEQIHSRKNKKIKCLIESCNKEFTSANKSHHMKKFHLNN